MHGWSLLTIPIPESTPVLQACRGYSTIHEGRISTPSHRLATKSNRSQLQSEQKITFYVRAKTFLYVYREMQKFKTPGKTVIKYILELLAKSNY